MTGDFDSLSLVINLRPHVEPTLVEGPSGEAAHLRARRFKGLNLRAFTPSHLSLVSTGWERLGERRRPHPNPLPVERGPEGRGDKKELGTEDDR